MAMVERSTKSYRLDDLPKLSGSEKHLAAFEIWENRFAILRQNSILLYYMISRCYGYHGAAALPLNIH